MKEIKNSIVSSISQYLHNLQYLAKNSSKTTQDIMLLIICDKIYTWADWYQVSQNEQARLQNLRKTIINNNTDLVDDIILTNEFYKNVNTPQTINTWERIYDNPLVQTFDTKFELIPDVTILRKIRDANPQSTQLAALFDDTKDPHTEWWDNTNLEGALFGSSPLLQEIASNYDIVLPSELDADRCYILFLWGYNLTSLNVTGLTELLNLDGNSNVVLTSIVGLNTLPNLQILDIKYNMLTSIDITGLSNLHELVLKWNQLTADSIAVLFHELLSDATIGLIDVSGIHNPSNASYSTWSSQCIADYNTLISRGWTIIYNS